MRNVLHALHYYLMYVLSTQRSSIVIVRKINIIPPQLLYLASTSSHGEDKESSLPLSSGTIAQVMKTDRCEAGSETENLLHSLTTAIFKSHTDQQAGSQECFSWY